MATAKPTLTRGDLRKIARARIKDAECLFSSRRYDGAVYLCGYAVEIALKARVCKTLNWSEFRPDAAGKAFEEYRFFRSHSLEFLLGVSGIKSKIKLTHMAYWSVVAKWRPELRYKHVGSATRSDAAVMIEAANELLRVLSLRSSAASLTLRGTSITSKAG